MTKTIIATGASSGIGFEAIKQLLAQNVQRYKFILGVRDVAAAQAAYDVLDFDKARLVDILPLELSDMNGVKMFAGKVLEMLGDGQSLNYLMLNAARTHPADGPGPNGSKWCETYIVNHLSQHYLVHLLRPKLVESSSRLVFVSSGAVRVVKDTNSLTSILKANSGADGKVVYPASKLAALFSTHWWRRTLAGKCTVVAVSPGLIPDTGIARGLGGSMDLPPEIMKDAKSPAVGGASVLAAFTRSDFPEDPDRIFLTSWGEWWGSDMIANSLDKELQNEWSPSKEDIEREEGVV